MSPADAIAQFLDALGQSEHPETRGTPERVAEFWANHLLSGHAQDPGAVLGERIPVDAPTVVTLTRIPFHGVCPHHLVPFFGDVHLAYEPDAHVVGLGRLEALVQALSRRLILQEQLCIEIVEALMVHLDARGAACAIEAQHLCLSLRGREPRATRVHSRYAAGTLKGRADILPPVTR